MNIYGRCNCGHVQFELTILRPIESYIPRACDCDFCMKRKIAYLSDPKGQLKIISKTRLKTYQHGSNQADFLACTRCDDVVAVACLIEGYLLGAVNSIMLDSAVRNQLSRAEAASPQQLSANEKVKRWRDIWMSVGINIQNENTL